MRERERTKTRDDACLYSCTEDKEIGRESERDKYTNRIERERERERGFPASVYNLF